MPAAAGVGFVDVGTGTPGTDSRHVKSCLGTHHQPCLAPGSDPGFGVGQYVMTRFAIPLPRNMAHDLEQCATHGSQTEKRSMLTASRQFTSATFLSWASVFYMRLASQMQRASDNIGCNLNPASAAP